MLIDQLGWLLTSVQGRDYTTCKRTRTPGRKNGAVDLEQLDFET